MKKVYYRIDKDKGQFASALAEFAAIECGFIGFSVKTNYILFIRGKPQLVIDEKNSADFTTESVFSYEDARLALKENGATDCLRCTRTIDDCLDIETCQDLYNAKLIRRYNY